MTNRQAATVQELIKLKVAKGFIGFTTIDEPVIYVEDTNRTFMFAVQDNGAGYIPTQHLLHFPDDNEVAGMNVRDAELLFQLPIKPPTQEVWHERRRAVSIH